MGGFVSAVRFRCLHCAAEYWGSPPPACSRCCGSLTQLPTAWAGRELTHTPRKPKVVSALQLRAAKFQRRPAGPLWQALFKRREIPGQLVVGMSGVPSSGKSTLALRLCEDGTFMTPLYASAEEGLSVGLADRASRLESTRTALCDAANLPELLEVLGSPEDLEHDLLVIDSLTAAGLKAGDVLELARAYPGLSILAVVQSRKDGTFAGSQALMHDVGAWIELDKESAYRITKSWWGELVEGHVPDAGALAGEQQGDGS